MTSLEVESGRRRHREWRGKDAGRENGTKDDTCVYKTEDGAEDDKARTLVREGVLKRGGSIRNGAGRTM